MKKITLACTVWCLMAVCTPASAQSNWAQVAVPAYTPAQVVQGLHRAWFSPRAQAFAQTAQQLSDSVVAVCNNSAPGSDQLQSAQAQWRLALTAWQRLSTVALGPLQSRRSLRQIDFMPTRPALIERAVFSAPQSAVDMERIGTPAKGFPALEWLLWTQPLTKNSAACAYAAQVAFDIGREAEALKVAFAELAERDWSQAEPAQVDAAVSDWLNQWVAGLERLRWAGMEKPLRSTKGHRSVDWPQALSQTTADSWAAQWQTLQGMAVFDGATVPVPGASRVPIETYLRGKGLNPMADRLVRAAASADRALRIVTGSQPSLRAGQQVVLLKRIEPASSALSKLKLFATAELATALEVSVGFSDADGD